MDVKHIIIAFAVLGLVSSGAFAQQTQKAPAGQQGTSTGGQAMTITSMQELTTQITDATNKAQEAMNAKDLNTGKQQLKDVVTILEGQEEAAETTKQEAKEKKTAEQGVIGYLSQLSKGKVKGEKKFNAKTAEANVKKALTAAKRGMAATQLTKLKSEAKIAYTDLKKVEKELSGTTKK